MKWLEKEIERRKDDFDGWIRYHSLQEWVESKEDINLANVPSQLPPEMGRNIRKVANSSD